MPEEHHLSAAQRLTLSLLNIPKSSDEGKLVFVKDSEVTCHTARNHHSDISDTITPRVTANTTAATTTLNFPQTKHRRRISSRYSQSKGSDEDEEGQACIEGDLLRELRDSESNK